MIANLKDQGFWSIIIHNVWQKLMHSEFVQHLNIINNTVWKVMFPVMPEKGIYRTPCQTAYSKISASVKERMIFLEFKFFQEIKDYQG